MTKSKKSSGAASLISGFGLRTRAKTTSHGEAHSPSPRPSPIGWERENRPPSVGLSNRFGSSDESGCFLSRRTGEGQGEGCFDRNEPPVRFLHKPSGILSTFVTRNLSEPPDAGWCES